MNCPLETPETAGLLLEFCSRRMDPASAAIFERHVAICPACRRFADGQRAVWEALDTWEAAPVTADFDRRLYRRLEAEVSWSERLFRPFRALLMHRGAPVAAACLVLVVGVLIERSARPNPAAVAPETANVEVQPEQVERALDAMDVLSEFNRKVRSEGGDSKL